ncbi:MAG TPA: glycoside hydrolase family 3 C-terminal domain-containing protein [Bacteroidales bacterium]|nr:glycoside hydrolase family 3 C-terminal domain-containing protein [Bacteroidales bacterium]
MHAQRKRILFLLLVIAVSFNACRNAKKGYKNQELPVEQRVEDLLSRMTLEEKIAQLAGDGLITPDNERLGIPGFKMTDGPAGVRTGKATAWPAGVALAASWDTTLLNRVGVAIGEEVRGKGLNVILGPTVNIQRMPFGGRNFESYSEDPYLSSRLAVSYVLGVQSQNVIPTVKHYICNNAEWERMKVNSVVSMRALEEIYFPSFKAAVEEAGARGIMSAYNKINGQYASENSFLLDNVLRQRWHFRGVIISDWDATHSTIPSAKAGLDIEMPQPVFFGDSLLEAVKEGKISEETINTKVRAILRVKFETGLFDHSTGVDSSLVNSPAHKELARQAAREGIVLLKNQNSLLPLDVKKIKRIAVIGPNADQARTGGGGSSHVTPFYSVSPLEGIRNLVGDRVDVLYALGDRFPEQKRLPAIPGEYFFTDASRTTHGLTGEYFDNPDFEGKPVLVRTDKNLDFSWGAEPAVKGQPEDNFSIRWTGVLISPVPKEYKIVVNHDDGVRFWLDGRLLLNRWGYRSAGRDTLTVFLDQNKAHTLKVEYYDLQMGAGIRFAWDHDVKVEKADNEPLLREAEKTASQADVAVIFAGLNERLEGEGHDVDLHLPANQNELIRRVVKANPHTIVVINAGVPMLAKEWIDQVPAFIDAFYLGQETGTALADVLFGKSNPSGRLPFTYIQNPDGNYALWDYRDTTLNQPYYEGIFVGYRFYEKNGQKVLFPFGYGLSYTSFRYSGLRLDKKEKYRYDVSVDVTNTGSVKGTDVVQLYVADPVCSVPRPVRELKSFARVTLNPGETKTVQMPVDKTAFEFFNPGNGAWMAEPGVFTIIVGRNSNDTGLHSDITIW